MRVSLWLIPGGLIVLAVASAYVATRVDLAYPHVLADVGWVFHAGPEGARATLSSIATSIMTTAGVAFSITVVVLQLASTQYSPRVLRGFLRDRTIQVILGAYLGTFTFVLLVLRSVRSSESSQFVPVLSVTLALVLAIACMVLLVVFVHHVAHAIRASTIVRRTTGELLDALPLYPAQLGEPMVGVDPRRSVCSGEPACARASRDGYVEYVDAAALEGVDQLAYVAILVRPGEFVRAGDALAHVWPASCFNRRAERRVVEAFSIHDERTMRQDCGFGVQILVDMALRALSPSMNDPTTAIDCTNALGAVLCRIAEGPRAPSRRVLARRHIVVDAPSDQLPELMRLAFVQLIGAGAHDPAVAAAVIAALAAIVTRAPAGEHALVAVELAGSVVERGSDWPARDAARLRAGVSALTSSVRGADSPDGG